MENGYLLPVPLGRTRDAEGFVHGDGARKLRVDGSKGESSRMGDSETHKD